MVHTSYAKGSHFVLCVFQWNFLKLPSQIAFKAHVTFYSLWASHFVFSYFTMFGIPNSCTLKDNKWLLSSLCDFTGLYHTSHSLRERTKEILIYAPSRSRLLTSPITPHPLKLQWYDKDQILTWHSRWGLTKDSYWHNDILFFVLYSFPNGSQCSVWFSECYSRFCNIDVREE